MAQSPEQPTLAFLWSGKRIQAAWLVAEDRLTNDAIAAEVGIAIKTLANWKNDPTFAAKVAEHVDELQQRARRSSFARLDKRNALRERRLSQINQVFTERGDEMEATKEVAGGGSGLLIRGPKSYTVTYEADAHDPDAKDSTSRQEGYVYRSDTPLLREEREILKDYAIDSGQFTHKQEITGAGGGPLQITTIEIGGLAGDDD